jgi:hypothetical protein
MEDVCYRVAYSDGYDYNGTLTVTTDAYRAIHTWANTNVTGDYDDDDFMGSSVSVTITQYIDGDWTVSATRYSNGEIITHTRRAGW